MAQQAAAAGKKKHQLRNDDSRMVMKVAPARKSTVNRNDEQVELETTDDDDDSLDDIQDVPRLADKVRNSSTSKQLVDPKQHTIGTKEKKLKTAMVSIPSSLAAPIDNKEASVSSVTATSATATKSSARSCAPQSERKTITDLITAAVNEHVYPYMKFITSESEMEPDFAPFAKKIMTVTKVDDAHHREWWLAYKNVAKHALQQKRSSVGAAVKKSVIGKN